jgi:hypothetical protein
MTLRGGASAMDELELLRRFYPEATLRDEIARARARERLRKARTGSRIERSRRLVVLGAAAVAAIAVVAIALAVLTGPDGAAIAELHGLARIAAGRDLAAGDRPVVYERIESLGLDAFERVDTGEEGRILVRRVHERWRSPDGSVLEVRRVLETSYPTRADERLAETLGFEVTTSERLELDPGAVPFPDLAELPLDPSDLVDRVREDWAGRTLTTDAELLDAIGELLARGDAAPELRAALFEAAARLDGIELLGNVTDPLGRAGVGLAAGSGPGRVVVVVDPRSTFLLSIEEHVGGGVTWRAYTDLATVVAAGERPTLG